MAAVNLVLPVWLVPLLHLLPPTAIAPWATTVLTAPLFQLITHVLLVRTLTVVSLFANRTAHYVLNVSLVTSGLVASTTLHKLALLGITVQQEQNIQHNILALPVHTLRLPTTMTAASVYHVLQALTVKLDLAL